MNLNQDSEAPYSIRSVFGQLEGSGIFANVPTPTQGMSMTQSLAQLGGSSIGNNVPSFGSGSAPTGGNAIQMASFVGEATRGMQPITAGGSAWGGTESRVFSTGNNAATAASGNNRASPTVGSQMPGQPNPSGKGVAVGAGNYQGGFSYTPGGVTIGNDGTIQSTGGLGFELPLTSVAAFTNRALDFTSNNSQINRGFLGGIINSGQKNVGESQRQVLDFGKGVVSSTEQMTANILNTQNQIAKRKFSGCFITTAICEKSGLPDDCEILQTFRAFRDTFMQESEAGRESVEIYYRTAPAILERIQKRSDCNEILETLRVRFLMPAFEAIKQGDNERARTLYVVMVIAARGMA